MLQIISSLSLDNLLEIAEGIKWLYKIITWIWGRFPQWLRNIILRFVAPSVTVGALAVIIDPYSPVTDPRVLLGWHTYNASRRTPWGLLGGALKKRDQEATDLSASGIPGQAILREILEETRLDIEIVKLLAIDTDWKQRTMDFYFECTFRKGYPDLTVPLPKPEEVHHLAWFDISQLPENVYEPHKRFLRDVLPRIPRIPGVSWTSNQRPPDWWDRFYQAERRRRQFLNSTHEPIRALATLVNEARVLLNCELVGIFMADPPIEFVSPDVDLPTDIGGQLRLLTESHERRGTVMSPEPVIIPLTKRGETKLGLTASLIRTQPLGQAIRLHQDWLHNHKDVKSWKDHPHLNDRTCHSLAAVAIASHTHVLGLLKAENKTRETSSSGSTVFAPFGPDDSYILEEFGLAAIPILENLVGLS